jgi:UDP-N-acetylglucosamine 4,6-dehydratase/5-epimerase
LHESLITPEESRHTSDHGWCYVVEPEHAFWGRHDAGDGTPVAEDFVYSSDANKQWLDVAELRELMAAYPAAEAGWPEITPS